MIQATIEPVGATCSIQFTARPGVPQTTHVPEPEPVEPDVDVGVFYFPGWQSSSRWAPIRNYPMRKPVLGWYDESNPECADWQIKWAVEHGVTFFLVDWYWSAGQRYLEHWLHNAYMKARHRRYCPPGGYPPNLIPADVGLGPYDLDIPEPKTAWQFDTYSPGRRRVVELERERGWAILPDDM